MGLRAEEWHEEPTLLNKQSISFFLKRSVSFAFFIPYIDEAAIIVDTQSVQCVLLDGIQRTN